MISHKIFVGFMLLWLSCFSRCHRRQFKKLKSDLDAVVEQHMSDVLSLRGEIHNLDVRLETFEMYMNTSDYQIASTDIENAVGNASYDEISKIMGMINTLGKGTQSLKEWIKANDVKLRSDMEQAYEKIQTELEPYIALVDEFITYKESLERVLDTKMSESRNIIQRLEAKFNEEMNGINEVLRESMEMAQAQLENATATMQSQLTTMSIYSANSIEIDGWNLIFRATSGNGVNAFLSWTEGIGTDSVNKPTSMMKRTDNFYNYRSDIVSRWPNEIQEVRFVLYEQGREVAYVLFDGRGSNYMNWFSKDRLIESSWIDLTKLRTFNYFAIKGHVRSDLDRRFYINFQYGGCPNDLGHLFTVDTNNRGPCSFDKQFVKPLFMYSKLTTADYWDQHRYGRADFMAIFVR